MQRPEQGMSTDTPALRAVERPIALNLVQARFFAFLFLISALVMGWVLWPFWHLLILAFLLAGIFRPIYKRLVGHVSPWLASILTCSLIVLIVFIPLFFCIITLSSEAMNLFEFVRDTDVLLKLQNFLQTNTLMTRADEIISGFGIPFEPPDMTKMISGLGKTAGMFIYNQVSAWAANIMSFVLQFSILVVVAYFLLIEMDALIDFIRRLSPLPDDQNMLLMTKFTRIAGVILIGNGMYCILQGLLGGIFFAILNVSTPVLWGVIMGILAFIPILGIGLVLLPAAIIFLVNGLIWQAIATVLFYLVLHYSVELLLKPKFVGGQLKMHALIVLLAIFGGMNLFGVLGIIYGPLIVSVFLTLTEMYLTEYSHESIQSKIAGGDVPG